MNKAASYQLLAVRRKFQTEPYAFSKLSAKSCQLKATPGFTLIELLVVIAIIGILATVVVVSMSASKDTGRDAAVKSNLGSLQVQASLYYNIGSTFGSATTSCVPASGSVFNDTTTTVDDITKAAIADATENAKGNVMVCRAAPNAWAAGAQLSSGNYWCVDSRGAAREVEAFTTADLSASTPLCPSS